MNFKNSVESYFDDYFMYCKCSHGSRIFATFHIYVYGKCQWEMDQAKYGTLIKYSINIVISEIIDVYS